MTRSTLLRACLVLIAATVLLTQIGCVPDYKDYDAFLKRPRPIVGGKPYVIEPPDGIEIMAPEAEEIDGAGGPIRPDGYITLALLGDVFVAGKTPTLLASEIEEKILKYYEDVNVQVRVTSFASKVYYMAGETSQGPKDYTGNDTVLDAVLRAGVPRTAWPEHLVVLRPNEEGELIRRMTINFRDMTERGDLKYNAVLEEGDIVYMPLNPLAHVGVWVQQLLQPIDPAIRAISTPAKVGAAATGL